MEEPSGQRNDNEDTGKGSRGKKSFAQMPDTKQGLITEGLLTANHGTQQAGAGAGAGRAVARQGTRQPGSLKFSY